MDEQIPNQRLTRLKGIPLFAQVEPEAFQSIAFELEERHLIGGETLLRVGEPSDSVYIVLTGRLRAYVQREGKEYPVGEIGSGESVGEMAMISNEPRSATVRAVRDTELVCFSREALERVLQRHPSAMLALTRTIVNRLKALNAGWRPPQTISTIALLPVGPSGFLGAFAEQLSHGLARLGSVTRVGSGRAKSVLGAAAVEPGNQDQATLVAWLNELENGHCFTLLEGDAANTNWTQRCLRMADRVLLVASMGQIPSPEGRLPFGLGGEQSQPSVDLVLVQTADARQPGGTSEWLKAYRPRQHYHVRDAVAGDFERLARLITGHAVGLVLSGGGARGYAHIGIIRAMEEMAVPIDAIGGVSFGALVGAKYAAGMSPSEMVETLRATIVRRRPEFNFTLPIVSLLSGFRFTALLRELFGELHIEDLWRPYFCVSSNLSRAELMIHTTGLLRPWVTASACVPGVGPPIPYQGDLLVDGGILNNLPIDVMRDRHAGTLVAVDVTQKVDMMSNADYVDGLSGWRLLLQRVLPAGSRLRIPNIFSILSRTATLASVYNAEQVGQLADLYLNPPLNQFETFAFQRLDDIVEQGYRYALPVIEAWKSSRNPSTWRLGTSSVDKSDPRPPATA